jgi:hypothetical protein
MTVEDYLLPTAIKAKVIALDDKGTWRCTMHIPERSRGWKRKDMVLEAVLGGERGCDRAGGRSVANQSQNRGPGTCV